MTGLSNPESGRRPALLTSAVFYIIAAFYAYGAVVHVLNIASPTGFNWSEAPLKWQVLDVAYLALDVVVVVGLLKRSRVGIAAFFMAAFSQICLYTVLRSWVLDVPPAFQRSPAEVAYLDSLVMFHIVTCLVVGLTLVLRQKRPYLPKASSSNSG
ncbi:MAG: hypothetical protein KJO30_13750 [Boseongicola sp.]|nr:hypothetical protein [Boseongicola sp.]NNJ68439.1 hypothetical protein [Boseongicola sp.]